MPLNSLVVMEDLRKCGIIMRKPQPIFYVMHASHKKWVEVFVFSFTVILAFIFEHNCFVKIMRMLSDQIIDLRCAVFWLFIAFFHRLTPH